MIVLSGRRIAIMVLFVLALVLNETLMPAISIGGIAPNLLIFFVVFYAIYRDPPQAVLIAVIIGLIEDLMIGRYIGLSIISYAAVAFAISYFKVRFYHENLLSPIIVIFTGSLVAGFLYVLLSQLVGLSLPFGATFGLQVLPQALYNAAITLLIYVPMQFFSHRNQANRENRRYHYHKSYK
ncbi:MAG: rod shape-determining protein MreD [Bacillota bacterium]|jgi:rod shape-determining protein MreD